MMDAWLEFQDQKIFVDGIVILGRHPASGLPIDHPSVSRRHAMIYLDNHKFLVADFSSRNGVYRNGVRITAPVEVRDKDKINLGEVALTFRHPRQSRRKAPETGTFAQETIMIQRGIAAVRRHVVLLDRDLRVNRANAEWMALMKRYFRGHSGTQYELPPRVGSWIKRAAASLANAKIARVEPLIADDGAQRLVIRAEQGPDDILVLIATEEGTAFDPARLQALGLSPREAEVMRWIAEGKSNNDIAAVLELSVSTVNKHVEHILQKLAVENRAQAILEVLERLGRG
jgi:DNA-binding CsgD family transcriptional regulator